MWFFDRKREKHRRFFCEVFRCCKLAKNYVLDSKNAPKILVLLVLFHISFWGVYFWKIKIFQKNFCVKNNGKSIPKIKKRKKLLKLSLFWPKVRQFFFFFRFFIFGRDLPLFLAQNVFLENIYCSKIYPPQKRIWKGPKSTKMFGVFLES